VKYRLTLFALAVLAGCTSERLHAVPVTDPPRCSEDAPACINAGAETRDVSGVHVIHERIVKDPAVAVYFLVDGGDRSGGQLWSEHFALEMLRWGGSREHTFASWDTEKASIQAVINAGMGIDYGMVAATAPVTAWNELWNLLVRAVERPANDDYLLAWLHDRVQQGYDMGLDAERDYETTLARDKLLRGAIGNRFRERYKDADSVLSADLGEAWAGMLTKERFWVVVVGDVEWHDLSDKVAKAFGGLEDWYSPGFASPPLAPPPTTDNQAIIEERPDYAHWEIAGCFLGPAPGDEDYAALTVAMDVLQDRLFAEVREARGLAYSVHAYLGFGRQPVGTIDVTTSAPSQALPVIKQVISELVRTTATDDEVATSKARLRSAIVSSSRNPDQIATALSYYQLVFGDRLGVERLVQAQAAVTPESARQALERYFRAVSIAAVGSGEALDEAALLAIVPGSVVDGGGSDGGVDGGIGPADGGRGGVGGD
jgi:predicted Zn-dependent peptidase